MFTDFIFQILLFCYGFYSHQCRNANVHNANLGLLIGKKTGCFGSLQGAMTGRTTLSLHFSSTFEEICGQTKHIWIIVLTCITLGPQPVGVQCPLTSSLGEFPGYWDWLRYPMLPPVLVSIAFSSSPSLSRCFSIHFSPAISVSSLRPTYLHPTISRLLGLA